MFLLPKRLKRHVPRKWETSVNSMNSPQIADHFNWYPALLSWLTSRIHLLGSLARFTRAERHGSPMSYSSMAWMATWRQISLDLKFQSRRYQARLSSALVRISDDCPKLHTADVSFRARSLHASLVSVPDRKLESTWNDTPFLGALQRDLQSVLLGY